MVTVPHFEVPFRVGVAGAASEVEQDSYEDISQCVAAFMGTPQGHRLEVPDFGVQDFVFATPEDVRLNAIADRLETYEPRAEVTLEAHNDRIDPSIRRVTVAVRPLVDVLPALGGAIATSGVPGTPVDPTDPDPGLPSGVTWNGLGTLTWNDMNYRWDQL